VKQHTNLQATILQHLAILSQQQKHPDQSPRNPPYLPLPQNTTPTSLTQAIDLLRQIWDSPLHGPLLRENRSLDACVALLLVEGYFLLDTPASVAENVALFFAHCVKQLAPVSETLLRPIAERLTRIIAVCRRDRQATGAWTYDHLCTLIQVLRVMQIIFATDPEAKAQFSQEHAQLLIGVHELVVAISADESGNAGNPHLPTFPRLQELVHLTNSLLQPPTN
jgi:hypothetical protein